MVKRFLLIPLLVVLAGALIFGGCAAPAPAPAPVTPAPEPEPTPAGPQYGGILKISRTWDATSLGYPPRIKTTDVQFVYPCVEGLVRSDEQALPTPWLAESWDTDADAATITLHLKKGVKFHDGTPFNAEAVKFNLGELWVDSHHGRMMPSLAGGSIDVLDEYTVRLNLPKWSNMFLPNLCTQYGLMISPTAYKEHDADWCNANPVGTGPFKFVSWKKDVSAKFEKFEDYWQEGKPYLDGVEWVIIVDPMTQKVAFLAGEQQVMAEIDYKDAYELEQTGNYKVSSVPGQYNGWHWDAGHDFSRGADIRVRQAFFYALDKQAIADALGYGYWIVPPRNQCALPGSWADNPDVVGYEYNPEKARQLLAEAGYADGMEVVIHLMHKPPWLVQMFTVIQAQLREVGVTAYLDLLDPGREYKMAVGGGWEDGLMWGPNSYKSPLVLQNWHYDPNSLFHNVILRHPEYQKVFAEAKAAPDFETMQEKMWECQKMEIDKYAITDYLMLTSWVAAKYPEVHDDDLFEVNNLNWHPENAWLEK